MAVVPVNHRRNDNSAQAVAACADYGILVADSYVTWIAGTPQLLAEGHAGRLDGLTILEIGPGPALTSAVLLRCAGARVTVADRFLAAWDAEYHPRLFTAILERVKDRGRAYTKSLEHLLKAGDFDAELSCHATAAEQLADVPGTFDVTLSNAVLEHVEDLRATVQSLALKTRTGGFGLHQVDLRDHRNYDRPLEFLTLSEQEFADIRADSCCECGGIWRASEITAAFEEAGFSATCTPNMFASPEYLTELRSRLRPEFMGVSDQELQIISAFYRVQRRSVTAAGHAA